MEPSTTLRMIRPLEDIATATASMDPSIRLQDIRKRMRVGRHKYAVPGWGADEHVSSPQESIFEHPLLPLASPGQDDAAELVNLLRIRDACANAEGGTSTKTPTVQPPTPTLSPPPTPGRDHDNLSFPTDFPKHLPLGSTRQVSNDYSNANEAQPFKPALAEKVQDTSLPSIRLKPTFTSPLLQDLISSHQPKTKGSNDRNPDGSSSANQVPELPFQTHVIATTMADGVPSSNNIKAPAKMSVARLPHRIQEITERATAA